MSDMYGLAQQLAPGYILQTTYRIAGDARIFGGRHDQIASMIGRYRSLYRLEVSTEQMFCREGTQLAGANKVSMPSVALHSRIDIRFHNSLLAKWPPHWNVGLRRGSP